MSIYLETGVESESASTPLPPARLTFGRFLKTNSHEPDAQDHPNFPAGR